LGHTLKAEIMNDYSYSKKLLPSATSRSYNSSIFLQSQIQI
jgi:hypothetical protein